MKKAIEIVNKFEMIPPSGSAGGINSAKVQNSPKGGKGLLAGGYNSGGEGSNAGGIEIDPFTGIPYYDPMKRNGKPSSS